MGLVVYPALAASVDPMNFPRLTSRVTDFSQVLQPTEQAALEKIAADYEARTTNQIAIILFPNRDGNELLEIGLKAFRENGLGQSKKNNGILLLIATDEKKIRIITGYGLE